MLKVSRRTLSEYRSNGTLPYYVLGGKVLYKRSEIEQAYQNGATPTEARVSGLVSAGAELLFEQIGGIKIFKNTPIDDVITKKLTAKISDKIMRTLVKLGIDVVTEEFLADEAVTSAKLEKALFEDIQGKANDADLAAIAKTGNVNDLVQGTNDVLVFNCGSASTVF